MTARNAQKLLDPRWHWLMNAAHRLYAELEPGAAPVTLTLGVVADGADVSYTAVRGSAEIDRRVLTDPAALVEALASGSVDATPGDPL